MKEKHPDSRVVRAESMNGNPVFAQALAELVSDHLASGQLSTT
jgi:hypothetical protein